MSHVETYKNLLDIVNKELKVISDKGEFKADASGEKDLHRLMELTTSAKNLCKLIECEMVEEYYEGEGDEYSFNRGRHSYRMPHSYRGAHPSYGWDKPYSYDHDMKQRSLQSLHEALNHATNEIDRREIQNTIERMQNGYM